MDQNQPQNHLLAQLSRSIELIYSAFEHYPLKEYIEYCPHCGGVEEKEHHLHRAPLNELTPEDLGPYASDALNLWGDSTDYRHFLPRIIELSLSPNIELGFEPWVIGSKLIYANWDSWPTLEKGAIQGFMETAWQIVIFNPPYDARFETNGPIWWSVEYALALVANTGIDIDPFLEMWLPSEELNPHLHLSSLAIDQAPSYAKKKKIDLTIVRNQTAIDKLFAFLLSNDIHDSLVHIFEQEINNDYSDLIAQGLDALEWMQQVTQRSH